MDDTRGIRASIADRRRRDRYFASDLFADPAWDMLLDLYAATLEGRRISVSSLCIAAAVPVSTALRWIATLEHQGLVNRNPDPEDNRRSWVTMTDKAMASMRAYWERTVPPAPDPHDGDVSLTRLHGIALRLERDIAALRGLA